MLERFRLNAADVGHEIALQKRKRLVLARLAERRIKGHVGPMQRSLMGWFDAFAVTENDGGDGGRRRPAVQPQTFDRGVEGRIAARGEDVVEKQSRTSRALHNRIEREDGAHCAGENVVVGETDKTRLQRGKRRCARVFVGRKLRARQGEDDVTQKNHLLRFQDIDRARDPAGPVFFKARCENGGIEQRVARRVFANEAQRFVGAARLHRAELPERID